MKTVLIHDRARLVAYFSRYPHLNIYHLGDLDDFFWPYTQCYGLEDDDGELQAVVLIYIGLNPPILLAITNDNETAMRHLLRDVQDYLPKRMYSLVSVGLESELSAQYSLEAYGPHYKMALTAPQKLAAVDTPEAVVLTDQDVPAIQDLYSAAYPEHWFDARVLETEQYLGIWRDEILVAIAGVHVYSPQYQVVALGNITTHPDYRGQGLGKAVTAGLCKRLLKSVSTVGLTVKQANSTAVRMYEKLGFAVTAEYAEWMLTHKPQ